MACEMTAQFSSVAKWYGACVIRLQNVYVILVENLVINAATECDPVVCHYLLLYTFLFYGFISVFHAEDRLRQKATERK